jgi:5'-phosphate synthase pdxT subunit
MGASPVEVRHPDDLSGVDALVIPGGESTTISKLARAYDLVGPVRDRVREGMPVLGTCAGMIVLAERVTGGEPLFGVIDIGVERNAYGRQLESFEAEVSVEGIAHPVRGVFIRAPRIVDVGTDVRVLAEHEGVPVVLQQGRVLVSSFHPELVGETGLHGYLLQDA